MKSLHARLVCCFASAFAAFVLPAGWTRPASADIGSCVQAAFALGEKQPDPDKIIRLYTLCLQTGDLKPASRAEAYLHRAEAYRDKEEVDRAIADYDQYLRLKPDDADAFLARGDLYEGKDQLERAIQDYDRAIRVKPAAGAFFVRGAAYARKGQYERAIQDYDQAIRLDPDHAPAFSSRGWANSNLARYDRAVADFRAAVRAHPNDAYQALFLFLALERSGGSGRAELAQAAAKLDLAEWPGVVVKHYLGQASEEAVLAATRSGDAKAQRELQCEAYFHLGMARLARGDATAARERLARSVATNATRPQEYHQARIELARLGAR